MGGPGANRKRTNLGKEAVQAALKGEWERAAALNRAVLELNPNDCEAANRLAKALMELGAYPEARQILETLRVKAPGNNIARKNLARLEQLQTCGRDPRRPTTGDDGLPAMFIAESGKSCTTLLRQPAGAAAGTTVTAGDVVVLNRCGEGVAITTKDGGYLGTIERRLGRRLHKLIAGGNQYAAAVVGISADGLSIMLRETRQHPALRNVVSFPSVNDEIRHRPPAVTDPADPEAYDDEIDAANGEPGDVVDGAASTGEGDVIVLADEVGDEPDDAGVPVLDDDVDADAWTTPLTPAAENEDDWE